MYVKPLHKQRQAFTLPEILVIVAIIAVLLALSGAAYFRWTNTQAIRATQAREQVIGLMLKDAWDQVVESAKKEEPSPAAYTLAGGDRARAQVIMIKARLMEAFPMTYEEIVNPWVYQQNLIPVDKRKYNETYKNALKGVDTTKTNPATQSAACLLIALTTINRSSAADKLDAYKLDTDVDGIEELVDAWYRPLWFYRFPTGNATLENAAPRTNLRNASFRDPLDPEGTLFPVWDAGKRKIFEDNIHKISPDVNQPAYYTVPAIVSAGLDEKMGLDPKTMREVSPADVADNIYSFTYRLGQGTP